MKQFQKISACNLIILIALLFSACKKEKKISPLIIPPYTIAPPLSPVINLHPIPFDTLSKARYNIVAGAAGTKILFAGGSYIVPRCYYDSSADGSGWVNCLIESNRVDIYDTSTNIWKTHDLPRTYVGHYRSHEPAITVGSKIFFSGGRDTIDGRGSDKVDVYDASVNSWSVLQLSDQREAPAVGALGNKVFFAGGWIPTQNYIVSNQVDIYDVSTNAWSTATLSEARGNSAVVSVGNKIIFAGGTNGNGSSAVVDIYDAAANMWSVASLSEAPGFITSFTIGNKAFFMVGAPGNSIPPPRKMDVYNSNTNSWSVKEVNFFGEGFPSVVVDNKALVFRGGTVYIYNDSTASWTNTMLNLEVGYPAIIKVGNSIYFAGGSVSYIDQTNMVWRQQF